MFSLYVFEFYNLFFEKLYFCEKVLSGMGNLQEMTNVWSNLGCHVTALIDGFEVADWLKTQKYNFNFNS